MTLAINSVSPTSQKTLFDVAIDNLQTSYKLQPEQTEQLLQVSIQSLNESLADTEQAWENSELDKMQRGAHKTKGTLLGIGLAAEAEFAKEIENILRLGEARDFSSLLDDLRKSLQPLLSA